MTDSDEGATGNHHRNCGPQDPRGQARMVPLLTEYSREETIRMVAEDLRAARARLGIPPAQAASRAGVAEDR